jgi:ribosomal protein L11 methyltransferase
MDYLELKIEVDSQEIKDILMSRLLEEGFESFVEAEGSLLAYIPSCLPVMDDVLSILKEFRLTFVLTVIPKQNWNKQWEKNYDPVLISDKCYIRAPFHPPLEGIRFDIVIEPKMSFGTAHHETTSLMIELMIEAVFIGKKVLDMGCGTGVLAIFARKLGAGEVVAVDIDDWSVQNTRENITRNGERSIRVIHGDVTSIRENPFDTILANINRNVLLGNMADYSELMNNGELFLSGFYKEDMPAVIESAEKNGFTFKTMKSKNNWVAIKFSK